MNPVSFFTHTKSYQQTEEESAGPCGYVRVANYLLGEQNKISKIEALFQSPKIFKLVSILISTNLENKCDMNKDDYLSSIIFILRDFTDTFSELDSYSNAKYCFQIILDTFFFNYLTKADMIKKCQAIFEAYDLDFTNIIDNFSKKESFLVLLQCLNPNKKIYPPSSNIDSKELRSLIINSNVPYLLESTSIEQKKEFLIMFQVYAILERIDMKPYKSNYYDNLYYIDINSKEPPFLKAINGLVYEKLGWHFADLLNVINPRFFPKFVNIFFNDPILENIDKELDNDSDSKITATIEYIRRKIDKFNCLFFFFDSQEDKKESAKSICINILDCLFVKEPQNKMLERCDSLIGSKMRVKNLKDFINASPFVYLLYFLIYKNLDVKNISQYCDKNLELMLKYCTQLKIPLIVDRDHLFHLEKNSNIVLYQLQFIYNLYDSSPLFNFIGKLKVFNQKLQTIQVPDFTSLLNSIKVKSYFLNMHTDNYQNNEEFQKIETVQPPARFEERYVPVTSEKNISEGNDEKENDNDNDNDISEIYKKDCVNFWNCLPESNISISNGILIEYGQENNIFKEQWNNELESFKEDKNSKASFPFTTEGGKYEMKAKMYKYAVYDESICEWVSKEEALLMLMDDCKTCFDLSKTPVILFLDSDENDIAAIVSKLINGKFPDIDFISEDEKEEMFLYLMCERNLSMLNVVPDTKTQLSQEIKPIFAIVHIPENKRNLPNMKTILLKIYSHFYYLCQISIVVLDKDHVYDQIEFIKQVEKISKEMAVYKDKSINDFYHSDAPDFIIKNNMENDGGEKLPKIILLLNENTIEYNNQNFERLNQFSLISMIQKQLEIPSFVSFININNFVSYQIFLTKLNEILIQKDYSYPTIDDIIISKQYEIELYQKAEKKYAETNNLFQTKKSNQKQMEKEKNDYIKHIFDMNYETEKKSIFQRIIMNRTLYFLDHNLGKCFSQRFIRIVLQLESIDDILNQRYLSLISYKIGKNESLELLTDEIIKYLPSNPIFRQSFTLFKFKILSKGNDITSIVESELKKSSDDQIKYLECIVNQKVYWSTIQIKMFVYSHMQFLNNEFFSIIRIINKDLSSYADDIFGLILEKQKNIDQIRIDSIFKKFFEKIKIRKEQTLRLMKDEMKTSSQYVLKERENIKEIKIALEVGQNLETVIEQDF